MDPLSPTSQLSPDSGSGSGRNGGAASKRKRPSRILTPSTAEANMHAAAAAHTVAAAGAAPLLPAPALLQQRGGSPADASIPPASDSDDPNATDSERGCKLSRVTGGGGDISSGSPVVLGARCGSDNAVARGHGGGGGGAGQGDESASTRGPLPLHPSSTPRALPADPSTSPEHAAPSRSHAPSPASATSAAHESAHSQTVLAALSARTHEGSVSVSAASSAWNTPASSALRDVSLLSTPSWSPAGTGDTSALSTSRHPPHSTGAHALPAYSFSERAIAAAAVAAALSSSAASPALCPSTPPSNVASPSASPRRVPDSGSAAGEPDAYALDHGCHQDGSLPYNLTVDTSSSFLARQRSNHAASRSHAATSPSSSPAQSPTSTASQLRPVPQASPPNLRLNVCPSSPGSVAGGMNVSMSPLMSPSRGGQVQGQAPALPLTLSPRCPQHSHAAALSPARQTSSGSASHASSPRQALSIPGSGSGGGARSPSPARSPGRSPVHTWSKPLFLSRLHVNIPEVSPAISSPIPLADTPAAGAAAAASAASGSGFGPRPSPAQAQRDREREQRGLPTIPSVPEEDGVVSCGAHYAVSLLKGRRRKMEDAFMQATIDADASATAAAESNDATADAITADVNEEDVTVELPPAPLSPPANLFGIADGHGKSGALVAQLTARLLPDLFQQNLRQALKEAREGAGSAAGQPKQHGGEEKRIESADALMSPRRSPPQPHQPVRAESILQSPIPSLFPPRSFAANDSPVVQVVSPSPPLSAASTTPLPMLTLSPAAAATQAPGSAARPPPSPLVTPAPAATSALGIAGAACEDDLSALAAFRLDGAAAASDPVCVALQRAFLQVDERVLAGKHVGGSTCTAAYVHQPSSTDASAGSAALYVASVGDSRCVLSRSGRAVALSADHKPCRPDERARVERAGGQVVFYSGWRVDGVLNISRALGDSHLKDAADPTAGRVIALPEVTRIAVDDAAEFVIVASDGVWSKVSNQTAIDIVRRVLLEGEEAEGGEALAAAPLSEEDALPPLSRPALAFDNSYLQPSPSGIQPQPSNPIQTPRFPGGAGPSGSYGRVDSNDSSVVSHHPMEMATPLAASLDSKGSLMSTAASALTTITPLPLSSPPPLHPPSASSTSFTPRHLHLPSPHAALRSAASSSPSALSRNSSTRLTSPTGGLTLAHRDSVRTFALPSPSVAARPAAGSEGHTLGAAAAASAASAPAVPMSVADGSVAGAAAAVSTSSSSVPCCWSSLQQHPERVAAASEALVRHAFDEANSMDNISVAVVLLYPFQRNDDESCAQQHA